MTGEVPDVSRPGRELPSIDAFVRSVGSPATVSGRDARAGAAQDGSAAPGISEDSSVRVASAGSITALAAALAVDLSGQVALESPEWEDRGGALAQGEVIRARLIGLAPEVDRLYRVALDALGHARASSPERTGDDLGSALGEVVACLLEVVETASDATALAECAAEEGSPVVRATAAVAAILAASATEAAAHLVEVNLLVTPDDERVRRARAGVTTAIRARDAAVSISR